VKKPERVANDFSPFEAHLSTAALMMSICSKTKHRGVIAESKKGPFSSEVPR
jgi:hypothetical protein